MVQKRSGWLFALIVDQHQVTKLSVYKQLGAPISPVARTVRDTHGLPTRCCYIRLHNRPVDPLCLSAHSPRTRTHARSLARMHDRAHLNCCCTTGTLSCCSRWALMTALTRIAATPRRLREGGSVTSNPISVDYIKRYIGSIPRFHFLRLLDTYWHLFSSLNIIILAHGPGKVRNIWEIAGVKI